MLDVGRHLVLQARRWLPGRDLVLLGDSAFSALRFLDAVHRGGVTAITRLRLDAALYDPAPPRLPGTIGRPRSKDARRPTLSKILTDPGTSWQRVNVPDWYGTGERLIEITTAIAVWHHGGLPAVPIRWVLIRDPQERFEPQALLAPTPHKTRRRSCRGSCSGWQVEGTFQEARAHLSVETQRQWSVNAIACTMPCLLALFSIVTLLAMRLPARERRQVAATAWYSKPQPTFSDALAAVRHAIWRQQGLSTSRRKRDPEKHRFRLPPAWAYALCQAA